MMKMDGRDSAECQKWEKRDITGINGIVKLEKDKTLNSVSLLHFKKQKENVKWEIDAVSSRF